MIEKQINDFMKLTRHNTIIKECCKVSEMNKFKLQGLANITTMQSKVINTTAQKNLFRLLSGSGSLNYYYIKTARETQLPKNLKFVYFKDELSKADPNNIIEVSMKNLKYYMFCIKFLDHDTNGFYFIVHKTDVLKFLVAIRKANYKTKYELRSQKHDFEKIEDVTFAYGIKSTTDNELIFNHLDEYERKLLYTYAKKAGVTARERKLLKQLKKGGKPFNLYIEELEEAIEKEEEENKREELIKELLELTEEDNSWNRTKTTLEDYRW